MRNAHICKTVNISRRSVPRRIIGDKKFESNLNWLIQSVTSNSSKIGSRNLYWILFKLRLWKKKRLELQTLQQLCSMTSAYLGRICVHFLELPFLKGNEHAVFLFKIPEKIDIFYVWWLPFSNQLKSYGTANWEKTYPWSNIGYVTILCKAVFPSNIKPTRLVLSK